MELSSRSVLFELLYSGLVDIRAVSGGVGQMTAEDRELVNQISNLLHNLPHRLEAALTDEECDELLADLGRTQRPVASQWIQAHLSRLGINPDPQT